MRKIGVLVLSLMLGLMLPILAFIPVTYAVSPVIVQTKAQNCAAGSCSVAFVGATSGNLFVVAVNSAAVGTLSYNFFVFASSQLTSPASAVQIQQQVCDHIDNSTGFCTIHLNNHFRVLGSGIFWGVISGATPSMTVAINGYACPGTNCSLFLEGYEVSGVSPQQVADKGTGARGYLNGGVQTVNSFQTSVSSVSGHANDLYVGANIVQSPAVTPTVVFETGYSNNHAGDFVDFPNSVSNSVAVPTTMLATYSAYTPQPGEIDGWTSALAAFGLMSAAGVIVTVVQACTFFQLQCWLYPMFFMALIEGFFLGTAMAFRVSEKALIYLLLAGATFASLIEIQLGIMTPMVPVLLIVGNIAYSFRVDRLIVGRGGGQR